MNEQLRSVLLGTAGLGVGAVVAALLTLTRSHIRASTAELRAAVRVAGVAILSQLAHFLEEATTGFPRRFPELLGLSSWSSRFFIAFNLFWFALWVISVRGLAARQRWALFPLWFLAVASLANGLAHPSFSLRAGGYFPGLFTSPLVGIMGLLLVRRMLQVTVPSDGPTDALVGSRVRLEYDDQNESFASYLPVEGIVVRRCVASTGPDDWYLVDLALPIDFQHRIGPYYQFERLVIPRVLIRSRWAGVRLGPDTEASVFLLLVDERQEVPQGPVAIDEYLHVCWARCRVVQGETGADARGGS